jgi:phospholipid/cholesterol/gamma-HCH transport system ATP-binding protein
LSDGPSVELSALCFSRGRREIFRNLDCAFARGRVSVVLGGSGAGKSTLLRLIGGLSRPDSGRIRVAGFELDELSEEGLFEVRDKLGMLFQHGALLDSLTLFENVALPLREHSKLSESEITAEVQKRLSAVGLEGSDALRPGQLSGGMNRRAGLARAIVTNPEILLCDEPMSGLDPLNVRRIESLLLRLNRELGLTLIVTSHHIPSALRMADQLVFLVDGTALSGTRAEMLALRDERFREFLTAELGDTQGALGEAGAPGALGAAISAGSGAGA